MKKPTKQDLCGAAVMLLLFAAAELINDFPVIAGICIAGMALFVRIGKLWDYKE